MNKINCNIRFFFSKTDEQHLFGVDGLIWNKTLGKIASLFKKSVKQPVSPSGSMKDLSSIKIEPRISQQKLVESIKTIGEFDSSFEIEKYYSEADFHEEVWRKLKQDLPRQQTEINSRKVSSFLGVQIRTKKLITDPKAQDKIAAYMQQALLLELVAAVYPKVSVFDDKVLLSVKPSNDKISVEISDTYITIKGESVLICWSQDKENKETGKTIHAYIPASITVVIPINEIHNPEKHVCKIKVGNVSENEIAEPAPKKVSTIELNNGSNDSGALLQYQSDRMNTVRDRYVTHMLSAENYMNHEYGYGLAKTAYMRTQ